MVEQSKNEKTFINNLSFSVSDDHTLALKSGRVSLIFHDFIDGFGRRYYLFNSKSEISESENTVTVRTAAVSDDDGAPIAGLLATYRFAIDEASSGVYASVSLGSDICSSGYTLRLFDVSWEGFEAKEYTGYEYFLKK